MLDPCTCRQLPDAIRQAGARCGWCVQAIIEGKNELVRENARLTVCLENAEIEERNIGVELAADRLLEVVRTGEHCGAFGGERMEACAQAIVGLVRENHQLRKQLGDRL